MDTSERVVVKRVVRRRRHPLEEKQRIVEETMQAGTSVARVARVHGLNANQVFTWRRQYRQGLLENANRKAAGLLAVRVVETPVGKEAKRQSEPSPHPAGMIQVELPKGHLQITGCVDAEALRVVLEKLLG